MSLQQFLLALQTEALHHAEHTNKRDVTSDRDSRLIFTLNTDHAVAIANTFRLATMDPPSENMFAPWPLSKTLG